MVSLFFYCLQVSSQMYLTEQIDNLCKMVLFFVLTVIKRISAVAINLDNAKGTVFWKQCLYLHVIGIMFAYTLPSPDLAYGTTLD